MKLNGKTNIEIEVDINQVLERVANLVKSKVGIREDAFISNDGKLMYWSRDYYDQELEFIRIATKEDRDAFFVYNYLMKLRDSVK
jgi:hypothetical protein